MTNEEKKLIAKYLELKGSRLPDARLMVLAINKMVELVDWKEFEDYASTKFIFKLKIPCLCDQHGNYIAWLMNPDTFFKLLGEWLKEKGK